MPGDTNALTIRLMDATDLNRGFLDALRAQAIGKRTNVGHGARRYA